MLQWSIQTLPLELRYTWKISRNATDHKTNLIVKVSNGSFEGSGEAAPNIRYKETPEGLNEQFLRFLQSAPDTISSVSELNSRLDQLGIAYALRFAIESAWHHMIAASRKISVAELLGIPAPAPLFSSYTIPIMDPAVMKAFYEENRLARFRFVKLKINADEGFEATRYLSTFCNQRIMIDANEAFLDVEECIRFLERIRKLPIEIVEQPLPAGKDEEARYLKRYASFPLFADESITYDADFTSLKQQVDGVNVKLMKAGGYLNGIRLLTEARKCGMRTMIGCMVETSLGISSGMNLGALVDYADLDSFLLLKQEPFGKISENNGELQFNNTSH